MSEQQFIAEERTANRILLPGDPGFEEVLNKAQSYKARGEQTPENTAPNVPDVNDLIFDDTPRLELTVNPDVSVNTPTQQCYDSLMILLECGRATWPGNYAPTSINQWTTEEESTQISFPKSNLHPEKQEICYSSTKLDTDEGLKIITLNEFYNLQGVNQEQLIEAWQWFEENKPIRTSKYG